MKEDIKAQTVETLKEVFPVGCTAYTSLIDCSKSGMTRWIKVIKIEDNRPYFYSHAISTLLDCKHETRNGSNCVRVKGCGMDMGFHLIYTLSSILHGDGYAIKQKWL
jgi:hypothetical protein